MELVVISLISLLVVPVAAFTSGPLRIALGLAFVLFFPGYALVAALFPKRDALEGPERLALSLGLSLAVVPLIGLALNYTPWGIRLFPILFSLATFILAMAAIAYYRRRRLATEERYEPRLRPAFSSIFVGWKQQGRWDRVLMVVLGIAILGALGSLVYAISTPKVGEAFTEFYILGRDGKAEGYPGELVLGEEARISIGVVNNEYQIEVYRIAITVDGERVVEIGPFSLEHRQKGEGEVPFRPAKVGQKQKVDFLLYKGQYSEPYRSLHLWVDVKRRP